jgi:hypothetical protein
MWVSEGRGGSLMSLTFKSRRSHDRPTYLPKIHLNVIPSYSKVPAATTHVFQTSPVWFISVQRLPLHVSFKHLLSGSYQFRDYHNTCLSNISCLVHFSSETTATRAFQTSPVWFIAVQRLSQLFHNIGIYLFQVILG